MKSKRPQLRRTKARLSGVGVFIGLMVCTTSAQPHEKALPPALSMGYGELTDNKELSGRIFTLGLQFPRTERRFIEFEGRFWYRDARHSSPPVNGMPNGYKLESGSAELQFKCGWQVLRWRFIEMEASPFVKAFWTETDLDPFSVYLFPSFDRRIGLGLGGEVRAHLRIEEGVSIFSALSYTILAGAYQKYIVMDPTLLTRERISKGTVFEAFDERVHWTVGLSIKLMRLDRGKIGSR